jgi:hypothetical protein
MPTIRSTSARIVSVVCLSGMVLTLLLAGIVSPATTVASGPQAAPTGTPVFYPVGQMATARANHAAVLLRTGKVLVVGGDDGAFAIASAELYDPLTGTWSSAGTMHDARRNPALVLLDDGKVLVAGGLGPTSPALASAEVYDPETNTWTLTGRMNVAVGNQTATLLPNKRVLVTGGDDIARTFTRCESWNPETGIWTIVASLATARYGHRANLLGNGKVLVTGGHNGNERIGTAELYDPASDEWDPAGSMSTATPSHTATTLQNGRVLIAGGIGSINVAVNRVEIYVPNGSSWLSAPDLSIRRAYHTAAVLPDGRVLIAGGNNLQGNIATSELFDPVTGSWTPGPTMTTARAGATSTTLPNGDVLIAGGNHNGSLASAEVYGISDCTIACPGDVTAQTGSVTATGTNVVYATPTTTGTCGIITCDPPSGSFFLVGTTTVSCRAGFGAECSFDVSVVNNPPPTITSVEFVKAQGGAKPKLLVRGTVFLAGAKLQINGVDFATAATVNSAAELAQTGRLTDGRPIKKALPRRQAVTITVTNLDGGTVSSSYTRP